MMQGGINHAALFGASQRSARSKLDQMAGISRPSGILASSPELMQAAMPMAPAPQPMPMPVAPQPVAAPTMPNMPMNTAVAPRAPAPRPLNPMAGNPTAGQPVIQLNEGGFLSKVTEGVNKIPGMMAEAGMFRNPPADTQKVDITDPSLLFVSKLNDDTDGAIVEAYGSLEEAAKVGMEKGNIIDSAVETTDDPSKQADAVIIAAGEQPTDAAKMDFAANVFGMEDVNDIDEINRRIANVAIGSAVGKGPDEFAKAVIMGLQTYKQTASARAAGAASAAAGAGGKSGMSPLEPFPDAVRDLAGKIMTATGEEASVAIKQAQEALAPYYTGQAGPTSSAPSAADATTDGGLPAVSTQAEYDALPSGAEFTQNGQKRKKP